MEIIVILLVLGVGLWWFFLRDNQDYNKITEKLVTPQKDEVARQVETVEPVKTETATESALVADSGPTKCGCGRSPTGYCIGLHALSPEDWAKHPDNPVKPVVVVEQITSTVDEVKPAKKKSTAKKKATDPKPVAAKKAKPAARTAKPKTKKA